MATPAGTGQYELSADRTQLQKDLAAAKQDVVAVGTQTEAQASQSFGKLSSLSGPVKAAIVGVGAAIGTVGGMAMKMGQDYAAGSNTLIRETGASGAALQGLQSSMKNVAGQVPEDLATVATAVGELSQKLDLTGPALDAATKSSLDFARANKMDVSSAVDLTAAAMQRLQIPSEQLPGFLDKITVAEQQTGIKATDLETGLAKVGPTLVGMGYTVDGSIALLSAWNKAGGDTQQLATGMNKAFVNFAKQGATSAQDAMGMLVQQIKDAPNDMVAAGDAAKIFGVKVGTTMAQQIRNGTLDVDALTQKIGDSAGALTTETDATKTWGDKFHEFFNGIAAQVGPFTGQIGEMGMGLSGLTKLMTPLGGLLGGIGGLFISGFKGLAAKVIPTAAVEATAIGVAEGEAETTAATGPGMIGGWLAKFGLMTGEKTAAAAAAGEAEGAAEGAAQAEAMGGAEAVGAAGTSGAAVATGFMGAFAPILAMGAAGAAVLFLPEILDHLTGQDTTSKLSQAGSIMADHFVAGYSDEVKQNYASTAQAAYDAALKSGQSYTQAAQAGKDAGDAWLKGYLSTSLVTADSAMAQHNAEMNAAFAQAGTDAGTTEGTSINDALAAALQDKGVPDQYVAWLIANTNAALDTKGKLVLDPLSQQLADWSISEGTLTGDGVSKGIADAMLAGGKPVSDSLYAMMNGIAFNADVNGPLASLYEKLNIPQNLAVLWASTGVFDMGKALSAVITDAGKTIPPTLVSTVLASTFGGAQAQSLINSWGKPLNAAAVTTGANAGKAIDKTLAVALVADASAVQSAATTVHNDLMAGLAGKVDTATAIAKKTMADFQKGILSSVPQTKTDSQQLGLDALGALEQAVMNGKGTTKGAKAIGIYATALYSSGMSGTAITAALAADHVDAATIAAFVKQYPQFFQVGVTSATKVHAGIVSLPWESWGFSVGDIWATNLEKAIGATNFAAYIAKHVGPLASNSPPKEGPLKDVDKWGFNIGHLWATSIGDGIAAGSASLAPKLDLLKGLGADVSGALGSIEKSLTIGRLPVSIAGASGAVGAAGSPSGALAAQQVVHFHIGTLVADDAGLAELERRMKQAARFGYRESLPLGGAY